MCFTRLSTCEVPITHVKWAYSPVFHMGFTCVSHTFSQEFHMCSTCASHVFHILISVRALPSACQTIKRKGPLSLTIGGRGSHQRFWDLEAIGSEWNSLLNIVNTIFNFSYQTGKRQRRSAARTCYSGSGAEPQPPTLLGAFGC